MRVKICGIRNERDLDVVIQSGADAIGFLVGLTHKSEDKLEPGEALELIKKIPPFISPVLVTHLTDPLEVINIYLSIGADVIQIHSDMLRDDVKVIRSRLPTAKLIKAIHVVPGVEQHTLVEYAHMYEPYVDAILLDSRTGDRLGGTGLTHDWATSSFITRHIGKPVILAGGLNPANVRDAICTVMPYGVDVNSGVEDEAGDKSLEECSRFVQRSKGS